MENTKNTEQDYVDSVRSLNDSSSTPSGTIDEARDLISLGSHLGMREAIDNHDSSESSYLATMLGYSDYDDEMIAGFFHRNGIHLVCIQGDTFSKEIEEHPDRDGKYFFGFAGYRLELDVFFPTPYDAFVYFLTHPIVVHTAISLITNHVFYNSVGLEPTQSPDSV